MIHINNYFWPLGDTGEANSSWAYPHALTVKARKMALLVPKEQRRVAIVAGAHIGISAKAIAEYFDHVVAFEPNPDVVKCLRANLAAFPEVQVMQAGLADVVDDRAFLYFTYGDSSESFVTEDPTGEKIVLAPLDMMFSHTSIALDLLYLNCNGYELRALRGAVNVIKKFKPMIWVNEHQRAGCYGATFDKLDDELRLMDYWRAKSLSLQHTHCYFHKSVL